MADSKTGLWNMTSRHPAQSGLSLDDKSWAFSQAEPREAKPQRTGSSCYQNLPEKCRNLGVGHGEPWLTSVLVLEVWDFTKGDGVFPAPFWFLATSKWWMPSSTSQKPTTGRRDFPGAASQTLG